MTNYYRWLLIIPILILILGASILLSSETLIKSQMKESIEAVETAANQNQSRVVRNRVNTFREDIKSNRESIYPYFLLGAGFLVALLILPKLTELTFSPTSGFTLKILQDVQYAIEEVKTTAQAVEAKAIQTTRINPSETLLAPGSANLNEEIKKLQESAIKLETYSQLVASLAEKKGKAKKE